MRSPGAALDLRASLVDELNTAIAALNDAAGEPKALHRCRVSIKRARALARVGHACAPGLGVVFNDAARSVMRVLSQARDLDALVEAAQRTRKRARPKTAAALDVLTLDIERERVAAFQVATEAAHTGLKDLLALAQVWPPASPRQIRRGGKRVARRARDAFKAAYESTDASVRHAWRRREKDRLYAAEMLKEQWPAPARLKTMAKLTDVLGRERDALLLLERLEQTSVSPEGQKSAERLRRLLQEDANRLTRRANKLGVRLHRNGA